VWERKGKKKKKKVEEGTGFKKKKKKMNIGPATGKEQSVQDALGKGDLGKKGLEGVKEGRSWVGTEGQGGATLNDDEMVGP